MLPFKLTCSSSIQLFFDMIMDREIGIEILLGWETKLPSLYDSCMSLIFYFFVNTLEIEFPQVKC